MLMNPDEIIDMPENEVIILRDNCSPLKLYKIPWTAFKQQYKLAKKHFKMWIDYKPEWAFGSVSEDKVNDTEDYNEDNNQGNIDCNGNKYYEIGKKSVTEKKEVNDTSAAVKVNINSPERFLSGEDLL
jgi:hypothetical protein